MPSALRSIIRHVWSFTRRAADVTTSIDTFNEFQLRDIGLTRDNDNIRPRAGDIAVSWEPSNDPAPSNAPLPVTTDNGAISVRTDCRGALPRAAAAQSPCPPKAENKDINISLCD